MQQENFVFDKDNLAKAQNIMKRYPPGRQASAVLPLLDLAQRQVGGWLPKNAINYVAHFLDMPEIRVYEVASFYTMFNLKPVGQHHIQICRTTPCWLRGSDDLVKACQEKLNIGLGDVTEDKKFSMIEVECLGGCCNAPVVQINDDFYEDLDADSLKNILVSLEENKPAPKGSQKGRRGSEPK
ncbi:MAG: NADH-quinone oxidoreductase subunit NuoE [Alphaproteobacteria bacterium]|nr:NADH-quinone oxidoreductase subunit NuoE [Alphaproteobacteria bacterium]